MIKEVKIPEDRVAILVGKEHSVINNIESKGVKIGVRGNSVKISGDALKVMNAWNMVKAIGRGFSPEKALTLNENKSLVVIKLGDRLSEKALNRQKARVIGEKGKVRRKLEELTETFISVQGKTVSVIGEFDKADLAKKAIEKLVSGATHRSVYNFLEGAISEK